MSEKLAHGSSKKVLYHFSGLQFPQLQSGDNNGTHVVGSI